MGIYLLPLVFPGSSAGKESTCSAGEPGSILGLGRSPGEGNDNTLEYSGLENSMDCVVLRFQRVGHKWVLSFHLLPSISLHKVHVKIWKCPGGILYFLMSV